MERLLEVSTFKHKKDVLPCPVREYSWEQLVAGLSHHRERSNKESVRLWSPVRYREGHTRGLSGVEEVHLLVLDFDKGAHPSRFAARWEPWEYHLHSTYSHTAGEPRWRAVFPLATPVPAERWAGVWRALVLFLTDEEPDPSCKDSSRLFYMPSCPEGDQEHFTSRNVGEWLDWTLFPEPPPLEPPAEIVRKASSVPYTASPEFAETLTTRALEEARRNGRHAGALWLFTQMNDNGFSAQDAYAVGRYSFLPALWGSNTKGEQEDFSEEEMCGCWLWAYAKPARSPWKAPAAILPRPKEAIRVKEPVPSPTVVPALPPPPPVEPEVKEFHLGLGYTAAALKKTPVPEVRFVVSGLLPVGVSLLVAHSKIGKSFMGLSIACGVAKGGVALSHFPCQEGGVLYVGLEDGPARVKSRLSHLLYEEEWPENLVLFDQWPTMGQEGRGWLSQYLTERPETALVILDPWNAVRPKNGSGDIVYSDYQGFRRLRALGEHHDCAILVMHHASVGQKGDPVNMGASTHGIPAACDAVLTFTRQRLDNEGILSVTGRDVPERAYPMAREPSTGLWNVEALPLSGGGVIGF